ncbi:Clavaminate synthase-like protein [Macrolepiota fuliginosa MF-IS2]|uniref:Clavaminate synthase-like protein n=1 Tax=Macrolepiota fuliginosa MF-IS2 TaxID=1400762 RepID=A0A9P6C9L9_9AGAR|nr:Clavaminate synthase-like protein [Macrolepiota fuliginosa MF-IS2]
MLAGKPCPASVTQSLSELADLAHEKMRSAPPTALRIWQVLYADACVLCALAIQDFSTASRSIDLLDRAIIIAGGGGGDESRLDLILSLINKIQQKFLPPQIPSRKFLNKGHQPSSETSLLTAQHEVSAITSNLSFISFQNTHSKAPFVIRGYAKDWPALKENSWNSIDYLLSISGPSRVVPVEIGYDYRDDSWSQAIMQWEYFLDSIGDVSDSRKDSYLYLAQHNLFRQFPSLRRDITIPDYVYCALTPQDFPDYKPLENAEGTLLNMWLGPKGATSPAHFDPYYNLYVQIVGYKTVWLGPPKATPYMETNFPKRRPDHPHGASSCEDTNLPNTSRLDVFSRASDVENDVEFIENVVPNAMQVVLGPGDLLFFPPGWWHGMRSETTSFSVSMWF